MNKKTRRIIVGYIENLEEIRLSVDALFDEEQEKIDNMPEGLQESERGYAIQFAIENLESASDSIGDAIDYLNEAIE